MDMNVKPMVFSMVQGILLASVIFACDHTLSLESNIPERQSSGDNRTDYNYLALGDSYTVGAGVEPSESFPDQLKRILSQELGTNVVLDRIAVSGWRTDNLLNALDEATLKSPYELVTVLIGVNNQFQNHPFSRYEEEFAELLRRALALANGHSERVIVISIPDYAYTPFGQNFDLETISQEIDAYNTFAQAKAEEVGVPFVDITDISRNGLNNPELVAKDGLHLSGIAYKKFVDRIFPFIPTTLKD